MQFSLIWLPQPESLAGARFRAPFDWFSRVLALLREATIIFSSSVTFIARSERRANPDPGTTWTMIASMMLQQILVDFIVVAV